MQATNLRIGNLLMRNNIVVTIDGRSIFDISFNEKLRSEYSEIPITEQWMYKFGFEKKEHPFTDEMIYVKTLYPKGEIEISRHFEFYNGIYTQKINTVNQLQNLWFALFNEELKTK